MVPTAKVSPGLWVLVRVCEQLSVAVGAVQVTAAPQMPASLFADRLPGLPAMTGFSLSVTVMVKLAVVVLPAASCAV